LIVGLAVAGGSAPNLRLFLDFWGWGVVDVKLFLFLLDVLVFLLDMRLLLFFLAAFACFLLSTGVETMEEESLLMLKDESEILPGEAVLPPNILPFLFGVRLVVLMVV